MPRKLPIVNLTPRQMLVEYTATKLKVWADAPERIAGLSSADFTVKGFSIMPSRRAVEMAANHVVDGGKPGTYAGSMREYFENMIAAAWLPFVAAVRKEMR